MRQFPNLSMGGCVGYGVPEAGEISVSVKHVEEPAVGEILEPLESRGGNRGLQTQLCPGLADQQRLPRRAIPAPVQRARRPQCCSLYSKRLLYIA